MKQHHFVKYHPDLDQITGSQQGTLILSKLEFWFIKKPDGFYKFMEPCSHRLYKKGDSWMEEVGLVRKRFARAFEKFGIKYYSRSAFEKAEDKFEGKLYASYYDCHTNQMFFIRNHELANETLKPYFKIKNTASQKSDDSSKKSTDSLLEKPLSTGQNGRSYKDPKMTSGDLSCDKSHAEEIIKKMIEIWTALVEEGRGQIELTSPRISFLKKAFKDKFDSCLEKWKKFCTDIASSYFLMGEVNDFRADIDWSLKFANIQKVLEGKYGIGKRTPKQILPSEKELEEEIVDSFEPELIKDFRKRSLKMVGNAKYISQFKNLAIEMDKSGNLVLMAQYGFSADYLERNYFSQLHLILQQLGEGVNSLTIFAPGETNGRFFEKGRGGVTKKINNKDEHPISEASLQEKPLEIKVLEDVFGEEPQENTSQETKSFRVKLRQSIPSKEFPSWLAGIEAEGVDSDGNLIVTFKEQIIADYCQARFRVELLNAAQELWPSVKNIFIQEKYAYSLDIFEEEQLEVDETSMFQQALQSLRNPSMVGIEREGHLLNDEILF